MSVESFAAEAERMGLTPEQLAEIVVQGAMDALDEVIARKREEEQGEAA